MCYREHFFFQSIAVKGEIAYYKQFHPVQMFSHEIIQTFIYLSNISVLPGY